MKKLFIKGALLCTALFFTVQADAQISLGNILKNVVSGGSSEKTTTETTSSDNSGVGGLLSSLTSIFSSNKVATEDKIIGTWVYEEPAVLNFAVFVSKAVALPLKALSAA